MKLSWIVVFGLSALAAGIAAHSLGLYTDLQIKSSQVACIQDQIRGLSTSNCELKADKDRLIANLADSKAMQKKAEELLAEEQKTHEPLRRQIANMNAGRSEMGQEVEDLTQKLSKLRKKLAEASSLADEFQKKNQELEKVKGELADFKNSVAQSYKESESKHQDQLKAHQDKIMTLEDQIMNLRKKSQELEKEVTRLEYSLENQSAESDDSEGETK
jgi:chromosome segregation ATPase